MKAITIMMICASLTGCATVRSNPGSFEAAVRASFQRSEELSVVVLSVQKDGTILVANRPTSLAEIETINTVELPEKAAIVIEAHRETRHKDVRAVMDACARAGIWRIDFKTIKQ